MSNGQDREFKISDHILVKWLKCINQPLLSLIFVKAKFHAVKIPTHKVLSEAQLHMSLKQQVKTINKKVKTGRLI